MASRIISCLLVSLALSVLCCAAETKLPSGMTQHQYCAGCVATVKEIQKAISKRHLTAGNRESKIMEIMEKICAPPNFVEYEYSPPKTEKACKLLMDNHEEDLESALVNDKPNIEQLICYDVSKACKGVDLSKKDKRSKYADIDLSDENSKTVQIDPSTQKVIIPKDTDKVTKEPKSKGNQGKTLSKKDKKNKDKKKTKSSNEQKANGKKDNKEKGGIEYLNLDVNDPQSMDKIVAQIKELTNKQTNQQADANKEEL